MSNAKRPVVVYGASGYTGRLVCEFLRQYRIPFVAAGRNAERIQATMDHLPGVESADYEVVAVRNTVESLAELLDGRSSSGPASRRPLHRHHRRARVLRIGEGGVRL